jgi:hypothetical protein
MRAQTLVVLMAAGVASIPGEPRAQSNPPACGVCADYGSPRTVGTVSVAAIDELSGLAASRVHAGIYYAHNDSGDRARFFALDADGTARGEFDLRGARAFDWEDIAVGPCPAGSCVYLGDIGDNDARRTEVAIDRVAESSITIPTTVADVPFERFAFRYPDGAHDAEALVVDPARTDVYVLTKRFGSFGVYRARAPLDAQHVATFESLGSVAVPGGWIRTVTAADAHPCEPRLLVRTYDRAFEFRAVAGAAFETVFHATPREVPVARERQGEAIAYRADGRGYLTASEGHASPLSEVDCRAP